MRSAPEPHGKVPDSWASPAGWVAPDGHLPGWNWTPPDGVQFRRDRVPRWVRGWSRAPFVDRWAYAWMWHHGGFDAVPYEADDPGPPSEPCGVPARPVPPGPRRTPQLGVGRPASPTGAG